ncbi:hypothetical protein INR49_032719 [Caranx melampygus]|nr:hypothetical protein INR49_032719 [Caranx melampygus]
MNLLLHTVAGLHSGLQSRHDPAIFKSEKTGRGPLGPDCRAGEQPRLSTHVCYKLVSTEFKWRGLQGKMENFIHKMEKRLFTHSTGSCSAGSTNGSI